MNKTKDISSTKFWTTFSPGSLNTVWYFVEPPVVVLFFGVSKRLFRDHSGMDLAKIVESLVDFCAAEEVAVVAGVQNFKGYTLGLSTLRS